MFRASLRTHRSRSSVDSGGRRCSICRIHLAGVAIVRPCAPSTSCLRNTVDCLALDGIRAPVRQAEADRSAPTPRPSNQSVRPRLPPNGSLESKPDSAVNLCPRALAIGDGDWREALNSVVFQSAVGSLCSYSGQRQSVAPVLGPLNPVASSFWALSTKKSSTDLCLPARTDQPGPLGAVG